MHPLFIVFCEFDPPIESDTIDSSESVVKRSSFDDFSHLAIYVVLKR